MIYFLSRNLFYLFLSVFCRIRVRAAKDFPRRGPVIIASNHVSFLDPAILGCVTGRRIDFMARRDLFDNKVFAVWARAVGCFPVNRDGFDRGAMMEAFHRLRKGNILAMFPEGTRSSDGNLQRPRVGVGFLAIKAGVPIIPVRIIGAEKVLPKGSKKIYPNPVEVRVGDMIYPERFSAGGKKETYQLISEEVMRQINRLYEN